MTTIRNFNFKILNAINYAFIFKSSFIHNPYHQLVVHVCMLDMSCASKIYTFKAKLLVLAMGLYNLCEKHGCMA